MGTWLGHDRLTDDPAPPEPRLRRDGCGPADGTPVVLLHGFPQDRSSWDRISDGCTRPGCGPTRTSGATARVPGRPARPPTARAPRRRRHRAHRRHGSRTGPPRRPRLGWRRRLARRRQPPGPRRLGDGPVDPASRGAVPGPADLRPAAPVAAWYMAAFQVPVLRSASSPRGSAPSWSDRACPARTRSATRRDWPGPRRSAGRSAGTAPCGPRRSGPTGSPYRRPTSGVRGTSHSVGMRQS